MEAVLRNYSGSSSRQRESWHELSGNSSASRHLHLPASVGSPTASIAAQVAAGLQKEPYRYPAGTSLTGLRMLGKLVLGLELIGELDFPRGVEG